MTEMQKGAGKQVSLNSPAEAQAPQPATGTEADIRRMTVETHRGVDSPFPGDIGLKPVAVARPLTEKERTIAANVAAELSQIDPNQDPKISRGKPSTEERVIQAAAEDLNNPQAMAKKLESLRAGLEAQVTEKTPSARSAIAAELSQIKVSAEPLSDKNAISSTEGKALQSAAERLRDPRKAAESIQGFNSGLAQRLEQSGMPGTHGLARAVEGMSKLFRRIG